jgi:hypothetical protein
MNNVHLTYMTRVHAQWARVNVIPLAVRFLGGMVIGSGHFPDFQTLFQKSRVEPKDRSSMVSLYGEKRGTYPGTNANLINLSLCVCAVRPCTSWAFGRKLRREGANKDC